MGVVGVAMVDAELRAKWFRDAENSCALEGGDLSGDTHYQAQKAKVISGEIEIEAMIRETVERYKALGAAHAAELVAAE